MTVEQLADLARVDRARIHRWHSPRPVAPRPTKGEKRGGPPSAITTEAIATALGVPPAALEVGGPWGPLVGEGNAVDEMVLGRFYMDCEPGEAVRVTGAKP